jgi:hypothetical protein
VGPRFESWRAHSRRSWKRRGSLPAVLVGDRRMRTKVRTRDEGDAWRGRQPRRPKGAMMASRREEQLEPAANAERGGLHRHPDALLRQERRVRRRLRGLTVRDRRGRLPAQGFLINETMNRCSCYRLGCGPRGSSTRVCRDPRRRHSASGGGHDAGVGDIEPGPYSRSASGVALLGW